jgi:hypothetical protein
MHTKALHAAQIRDGEDAQVNPKMWNACLQKIWGKHDPGAINSAQDTRNPPAEINRYIQFTNTI